MLIVDLLVSVEYEHDKETFYSPWLRSYDEIIDCLDARCSKVYSIKTLYVRDFDGNVKVMKGNQYHNLTPVDISECYKESGLLSWEDEKM